MERLSWPRTCPHQTPAALRPPSLLGPTRLAVIVDGVACLDRAINWFAEHGLTIERILTDNGHGCHSLTLRRSCAGLDITCTRPHQLAANGQVECFNCALADEQAYLGLRTLEAQRARALYPRLHRYNYYRYHTAIDSPAASRVSNHTIYNNQALLALVSRHFVCSKLIGQVDYRVGCPPRPVEPFRNF